MNPSESPFRNTYCNPLPLPNYPRGRACRDKTVQGWGWTTSVRHDFRETADPSVLFHDGRWYLYPSCGMAWVSADFRTWQHHPMNIDDVGYAPTILKFKDRFYLTACNAPLYVADTPLGPFREIGSFLDCQGRPIEGWGDPMLFADDDERIYAYWGCGGPGIFCAELDSHQPNRCLTSPQLVIRFDPAHTWECYGTANEDPTTCWIEGAWMVKIEGRYFLTYSAPGTQFRTYAFGVYVADSPLGPFHYQQRNPILRDPDGLVQGPGHGCIVRGPRNTLWAFYTCLIRNYHVFERRTGLDPAGLDANGNLFVKGASDFPQWTPGLVDVPETGNYAGLLPITIDRIARASSEAPGRTALYAVDNSVRTWWEAAPNDPRPWIEVDGEAIFNLAAIRLLWAEPQLDYELGRIPGPFQFHVEVQATDGGPWTCALDCTDNREDLLIDYRVLPVPLPARRIRLTITGWPQGMTPALLELTAFGTSTPPN